VDGEWMNVGLMKGEWMNVWIGGRFCPMV